MKNSSNLSYDELLAQTGRAEFDPGPCASPRRVLDCSRFLFQICWYADRHIWQNVDLDFKFISDPSSYLPLFKNLLLAAPLVDPKDKLHRVFIDFELVARPPERNIVTMDCAFSFLSALNLTKCYPTAHIHPDASSLRHATLSFKSLSHLMMYLNSSLDSLAGPHALVKMDISYHQFSSPEILDDFFADTPF